METLQVALDERSYPILIGPDLLTDGTILRAHIQAAQLLVVSNEVVAPLFLDRLTGRFTDRHVATVILPDGEAHKSLESFSQVMDTLVSARFHRDCCVVALGGGVVGDLAGFAAACYQRGVDYVQIPTTLLAQVDSSVGGKTAVNHPGGKNLIGAFYQPRCVLADTNTLKTLPPRELSAGLAEVIKYGLILDGEFFCWLEDHIAALRELEPHALRTAIRRSCELKALIVAEDEREAGRRALLNLGHTFGHAIEAATGYGEWLHGEAVGAGLLLAAKFAARSGTLSDADVARIESVLKAAALPTSIDGLAAEQLLDLMALDKKTRRGELRLITLTGIGAGSIVNNPPRHRLMEVLKDCGAV